VDQHLCFLTEAAPDAGIEHSHHLTRNLARVQFLRPRIHGRAYHTNFCASRINFGVLRMIPRPARRQRRTRPSCPDPGRARGKEMGADGYLDHSSHIRSRQACWTQDEISAGARHRPGQRGAKIGPLDIAVGEDDHVKTGMLEAKVSRFREHIRPCRLLVYTRRHSFAGYAFCDGVRPRL